MPPPSPSASQAPERLFDPAVVADPYPYLAWLSEHDPVHEVEGTGVFLVARMDLVREVVGDPATFSNQYQGFLHQGDRPHPVLLPMAPDPREGMPATPAVLATADPPDHERQRRVVQRRLSAGRIQAMEPEVRALAAGLLGGALARGRIEWMDELANPLPVVVTTRVLGLPDDLAPLLGEMGFASVERIGGLVPDARIAELDQLMAGDAAGALYEAYERAKADPDEETLTGVVAAAANAGELDDMEALSLLILVVSAGGESTASLLGTAAWILAERADLQQRLRDDPRLVAPFVEEVLRIESPFRNHYRLVTRDTVLGGRSIPAGSHLALLWSAANRDPQAYPDPARIDVDRPNPRQHVGFGWGIHLCVGAPLARLEARVALEVLLAATGSFTLEPSAPPVRLVPSLQVRRPEALALRLDGAPPRA